MKQLARRDFIKALGAGAASLAASKGSVWASAQDPRRKPNTIFIMADDLGYADLGCYGSKAIKTPRLNRMAAEGMRFTQAYSGCTVCAPARCTLMTGKHMGHASVRGNTGGIPLLDSDVTVAELLKKAGYATGGFGKWGLGDIDTNGAAERQGFDTFYGYYHQIHAHSYYPDYLIRNGKKEVLPGNRKGRGSQYSHSLIFNETLKFIRANRDRPFFCYAPWTPPHGRYEIPPDELALKLYKDKKWPKTAKIIAAMDTMIDRQAGQLLDLLDELGIAENTIVFFCSDNGTDKRFDGVHDSAGPLRGQKRDMYEGGIRTPMIVRWPGRIQPRTVSDHAWYFPDVLPTLVELAGASRLAPKDIDGISVVPTLLGTGKQAPHDYMYWEWPRYSWRKKAYEPNGLMQAVRAGDWKLLRHKGNQPWELYDLAKDLGEKNNLAGEHPNIVAKLAGWIDQNRVDPRPQHEPKMPAGKKYR